ncbi:hemerythrin domain-containing protein [Skermanella sp. TT6]|uniref:Hemerythrin domain-containing protein n=1 Tax=Skermanella cutis TaxID=2775420 RepID=A0ABX7B9T7_9PROT|nr:hemerythrin domain-containing protein [Skermanella sp. TT6]QQP91123.1 hemerythrin domain-containing protein [Skermanella sp. TT6]
MTPAIITAINDEHRTIAKLLHLIDRQVTLFNESETPDLDLLHLIMDYTQAYPDLYHHPKENAVFRKLREREPAFADAVDALLEDHARMPQVSAKFATLVEQLIEDATMPRDVFVKAAMDYVDFQRSHMMREVGDVLPAAARILTAEDWAELESSVGRQEDPLTGGKAHYQKLGELLLSEA